jgi:putative cell wall-binding protein
MKNKGLRFAFSMLFLLVILLVPTEANASPQLKRIWGKNRYETSKAIADEGWTKSQYAVIVSGENFPDALSASVLAKKYNAPILLSAPARLDSNSLMELKKLEVSEVFIVGGKGAINDAVETSVKNLGINVNRLSGSDRYETSEKVAQQIGVKNGVILATGSDYADALSASPIASGLQMPIILVQKDSVTQSVQDLISSKEVPTTYIIGGTDIISDSVAGKLNNVKRIAGNDKYERNINVLNTFSSKLNYSDIYLAYGDNFPDALSGSALAGEKVNPIILVDSCAEANVKNFLQDKLNNISKIGILGGTGVLPDNIIDAILENDSISNKKSLYINDVSNALNLFNSDDKNSETVTNLSVAHNGLAITLDKIEQDYASLRIYVTYTNNSDDKIIAGDCLAKILCSGTEYKYISSSNIDRSYNDNIIEPKASERSVIFFKPVKNTPNISVRLNGNSFCYNFDNIAIKLNDDNALDKFYDDIGTDKADIVKKTYDIFNPQACKIDYKDNYKAVELLKIAANPAEDNASVMLQFFNNGHIGISFTNVTNIGDSTYLRELLSNTLSLYGSSSDAFLSEIANDSLTCLMYSEKNIDQIECDAFANSNKIYIDKTLECSDGIAEYRLGMRNGKQYITTLAIAD